MSTVPALADAFEPIHYPETDGEPMAESDVHREELVYLIEALRDHFRELPDLYVSGNLLLYYQKGNPKACVAPDVFVVPGAGQRWRRKYLLWEEAGRVPCTVIEVTSASTRERDLGEKKRLYARLGVAEYFLYDPAGEALGAGCLRGFRLRTDGYHPLRPRVDGSLHSRSLGLLLRIEEGRLRLIDEATGQPLLRGEEVRKRARKKPTASSEEPAVT